MKFSLDKQFGTDAELFKILPWF